MTISFFEYLKAFDSPKDITGKTLETFTRKLLEYNNSVREKERNEIPDVLETGRKLRNLGAPTESYKILKADAHYYKYRGDERKFWRQLYFAGAFANLGYPTKSIEKEAKEYCKILRGKKALHPFLPLFLNTYAGILHIYREDYPSANALYREAISLMENIKPRNFESTVDKEYLWAHKLILNNYLDSLFVTKMTRENEEELKRMLALAESNSDKTESEYVKILTLLNKAEMNARMGKGTKADQILKDIFSHVSKEQIRYIEPSYHRIKALILTEEGKDKESIDYMIRSFEESKYYGNTLEETLTIRDSLLIYNILASKSGIKDRYIFFKENGLFDYLLKVLKIKDWFLGAEHSVNVSKTAAGIASILSLSPGRLCLVKTSSLLHDIGKIIVPWYSLNKISPLDSIDREILQAHTIEGGRILRKLGLNKEAEIVENHHERIDGSGYPKGIKDISIEAEIVAVSDVYNAAITPNRKYKIPKTSQEILSEIRKESFSLKIIRGLEKCIQMQVRSY